MFSEVRLCPDGNNTLRFCMNKDPCCYFEWKKETTDLFSFDVPENNLFPQGSGSNKIVEIALTISICCLLSIEMTNIHHIRFIILLGNWCWLNVPVDRRMSTFLYPGTGRVMDVGFQGVTLLTPGTSETLHRVTKFLQGPVKTLGIFLYIFVTILYFILLDSLWREWEKAWNMKTHPHTKRSKINKVGLHCLCGWPKISPEQ